jgi:hypothetical protein
LSASHTAIDVLRQPCAAFPACVDVDALPAGMNAAHDSWL